MIIAAAIPTSVSGTDADAYVFICYETTRRHTSTSRWSRTKLMWPFNTADLGHQALKNYLGNAHNKPFTLEGWEIRENKKDQGTDPPLARMGRPMKRARQWRRGPHFWYIFMLSTMSFSSLARTPALDGRRCSWMKAAASSPGWSPSRTARRPFSLPLPRSISR